MASGAQVAGLFDYLYRDSGRITSYYAQIFGGVLNSTQEVDSKARGGEKSTIVGPPFALHQEKTTRQDQTGETRTTSPHDVVISDVLSHLVSSGIVQGDAINAPHSALIISKGTLVFVDRSMLEIGMVSLDIIRDKELSKPKNQRDNVALETNKMIKAVLGALAIPSSFLLRTSTGLEIVGTIKDEGMEEPISTYYFKHGMAGLSDVYVVGIKEIPNKSFTLPEDFLMGAGQAAAQALTEMLFPPAAMRVTPLALFRPIHNSQQIVSKDE